MNLFGLPVRYRRSCLIKNMITYSWLSPPTPPLDTAQPLQGLWYFQQKQQKWLWRTTAKMRTVTHHQSLHHQVSRTLTIISFFFFFSLHLSEAEITLQTTSPLKGCYQESFSFLECLGEGRWRGSHHWFKMQSVVVVVEYDVFEDFIPSWMNVKATKLYIVL